MGSSSTMNHHQRDQHDRFVGVSPTLEIKIGGVSVKCLVDTGSMVSTITEDFFRTFLKPTGTDLVTKGLWLSLWTCATGLSIPYIGYLEIDVKVKNVNLPKMGIIVVENSNNREHFEQKQLVPMVLGMNILSRAIENGVNIASQVELTAESKSSLVHTVAGVSTFIPAQSWTTVVTTSKNTGSRDFVVEPLRNSHNLPIGVLVESTIVNAKSRTFPVRMVNLSSEGKVVLGQTPIGITNPVMAVTTSDLSELQFSQASVNEIMISKTVIKSVSEPASEYKTINVDLSEFDGTNEELGKIHSLLHKHREIFAETNLDLGDTTTVTHRIVTKTDDPVAQTFRRIHVSPNQFEEVKQHIRDLLQAGVIRESFSPYAAPIVLAKKKDGLLRMCVDYSCLNANTKRDAFPLPRILESLDAPIGAKFFSTLDLASGYHQVRVKEEDREKTAFITPLGLYEYNRMPFGLCGAPATFQRSSGPVEGLPTPYPKVLGSNHGCSFN